MEDEIKSSSDPVVLVKTDSVVLNVSDTKDFKDSDVDVVATGAIDKETKAYITSVYVKGSSPLNPAALFEDYISPSQMEELINIPDDEIRSFSVPLEPIKVFNKIADIGVIKAESFENTPGT